MNKELVLIESDRQIGKAYLIARIAELKVRREEGRLPDDELMNGVIARILADVQILFEPLVAAGDAEDPMRWNAVQDVPIASMALLVDHAVQQPLAFERVSYDDMLGLADHIRREPQEFVDADVLCAMAVPQCRKAVARVLSMAGSARMVTSVFDVPFDALVVRGEVVRTMSGYDAFYREVVTNIPASSYMSV